VELLNGTQSQSYVMSLVIWDHNVIVLPATQHKRTHPA